MVRAYLNYGRWVADCPNPDCQNAVVLKPREEIFHCSDPWEGIGCKTVDFVVWPDDVEAIEAAVDGLDRSRQSWVPEVAQ